MASIAQEPGRVKKNIYPLIDKHAALLYNYKKRQRTGGGTMAEMELTALLVFLLLLVLILIVLAVAKIGQIRYSKAPRRSVRAEVVKKRSRFHYSAFFRRYSEDDVARIYSDTTNHTHTVTFLLEDGKQIRFRVFESDYSELKEGMRGELTYKGKSYLAFKRYDTI
jgi:hypothetical protein